MLGAFSLAHADESWVEVTSPHFSVFTDGGEKRAREVIQRFEEMRIAFGAIFTKVSVNTPPLQIIAFRNAKGLREHSTLYEGKPVELAGFFLGNGGQGGGPGAGNDRQYIAVDLSRDDWGTVFHEYAHLLINSNFPPSPLWFDEGFAEYCSSLKMDKHDIQIGLLKPGLTMLLLQSRWLKIEDLFSVDHKSSIYNRDDRRSVFYAESWATVHYLMARKMLRQASVYIDLVQNQHVPVAEAIRKSFGMEPAALQREIENYIRTGTMHFQTKTPPGADEIKFNTRALSAVDVKAALADLDYHSRDYRARSLEQMQDVLKTQPDNFLANFDLGVDALYKRDWSTAEDHLKRAVASDVKDPRAHFYLASLISHRTRIDRKSDDAETILKELSTAIALDPTFAEAYDLLGVTFSSSGKNEEGIAALTKATMLNPRNDWFKENLANAYLRARDFDKAISLLKDLQNSTAPLIGNMATEQLKQAEKRKDEGIESPRLAKREQAVQTVEAEPNTPAKSDSSDGPAITLKQIPIAYMKGVLNSVDCSVIPGATLTISSAGKKWKLQVPDTKKVVLIGADNFSCAWTNKKVTVNYHKTGDDEGNLVSLELE